MEKTKIKVQFALFGDKFDPNIASNKLSINPTSVWRKGDIIEGTSRKKLENCWELSSGFHDSLDVMVQLKQIFNILLPKVNELKSLVNELNLEAKFDVVIEIWDKQSPAMYLNLDILNFSHEIKATFDFDLYILE